MWKTILLCSVVLKENSNLAKIGIGKSELYLLLLYIGQEKTLSIASQAKISYKYHLSRFFKYNQKQQLLSPWLVSVLYDVLFAPYRLERPTVAWLPPGPTVWPLSLDMLKSLQP